MNPLEHVWAWLSVPLGALILWMLGARVGKNGKVTDTLQERLLGEGERLEEKLEKTATKLDALQQELAELRAEATVLRAKAQLLRDQLIGAGLTPVVGLDDPT